MQSPKIPEKSFIGQYFNDAFSLISRGRTYTTTQNAALPNRLNLHDIRAFFDVYGCDMDKGIFVECIFALDNKFIEAALRKQ